MSNKSALTRRSFVTSSIGLAVSSALKITPGSRSVEAASPAPGPLRLSRNESPYGLSPSAAEALRNAIDPKSSRYPIEEPKALEEAIAKRFGVEKENVLLGCGSIEILRMATETFCNPSNPAGTLIEREHVERFVRRLPRGTVLLSDEAYAEYVDRPDYESCLRFVKEGLPVVVSRTFSKIYGMAGLRVGYAIGRKDLIKRMAKRRLANNPNQLATAAALGALKNDGEFVSRARKLNSEVRDYVCRELTAMGLKYIPSETNFVMIRAGQPAKPLIEELKKRNVIVGRLFPSLPEHVRVSFGTMAEMRSFVKEFREVVGAHSASS